MPKNLWPTNLPIADPNCNATMDPFAVGDKDNLASHPHGLLKGSCVFIKGSSLGEINMCALVSYIERWLIVTKHELAVEY